MKQKHVAVLLLVAMGLVNEAVGQQSESPGEGSGIVGVSKQFIADEAHLWTSPFRVQHDDLKWIVPVGIVFAGLLTSDRNISTEIAENKSIQGPSHAISQLGSYPLYLTSAALIGLGHIAHKERTAHAGSVGLQAVLHSEVIVQALKASTNRERPNKNSGDGGFWDGGKSFPSGHSISSWAFAEAMSDQYPDKKWVRLSAYGVATAVSISRITGQNHFPSDVLVGSSLGWLIGHYISRHHR